MQAVKKLETRNNIYQITYDKISKTTYEERQEEREEFKYMLIQKSLGLLFIIVCLIAALVFHLGIALVLAIVIGLPLLLTKNHMICI